MNRYLNVFPFQKHANVGKVNNKTSHYITVIDKTTHWMLDTGCWILDTGYWICMERDFTEKLIINKVMPKTQCLTEDFSGVSIQHPVSSIQYLLQ
jgi:hypothetical protein